MKILNNTLLIDRENWERFSKFAKDKDIIIDYLMPSCIDLLIIRESTGKFNVWDTNRAKLSKEELDEKRAMFSRQYDWVEIDSLLAVKEKYGIDI